MKKLGLTFISFVLLIPFAKINATEVERREAANKILLKYEKFLTCPLELIEHQIDVYEGVLHLQMLLDGHPVGELQESCERAKTLAEKNGDQPRHLESEERDVRQRIQKDFKDHEKLLKLVELAWEKREAQCSIEVRHFGGAVGLGGFTRIKKVVCQTPLGLQYHSSRKTIAASLGIGWLLEGAGQKFTIDKNKILSYHGNFIGNANVIENRNWNLSWGAFFHTQYSWTRRSAKPSLDPLVVYETLNLWL